MSKLRDVLRLHKIPAPKQHEPTRNCPHERVVIRRDKDKNQVVITCANVECYLMWIPEPGEMDKPLLI